MPPNVKVLGPFSPKDFADPSTLSTTVNNEVVAAVAAGTLVAVDPVQILGNTFLVVSWTI